MVWWLIQYLDEVKIVTSIVRLRTGSSAALVIHWMCLMVDEFIADDLVV
jgi:hypothetical protein